MPLRRFVSSPLGVVPKKDPGSFRIIHDLSFPTGQSVNDLIPQDLTSVVYEDFDHVASLVVAAGKGALIAKVDIQSAFRILPIHSDDRHLFGFKWRGAFYFDNCLPLGCSLSCALIESFLPLLYALYLQNVFSSMSHILDDFIFIGPHDTSQCQWQLQQFLHFAALIGIPIKESKTVEPTLFAIVHGIQINTHLMVASLPPE